MSQAYLPVSKRIHQRKARQWAGMSLPHNGSYGLG